MLFLLFYETAMLYTKAIFQGFLEWKRGRFFAPRQGDLHARLRRRATMTAQIHTNRERIAPRKKVTSPEGVVRISSPSVYDVPRKLSVYLERDRVWLAVGYVDSNEPMVRAHWSSRQCPTYLGRNSGRIYFIAMSRDEWDSRTHYPLLCHMREEVFRAMGWRDSLPKRMAFSWRGRHYDTVLAAFDHSLYPLLRNFDSLRNERKNAA